MQNTFLRFTNYLKSLYYIYPEKEGVFMKFQNSIDVTQYKSKGFISAYQKLIKETVIPFQYDVMCDNVEGADKSHVIKNFVNAGKALMGENTDDGFFGMVFHCNPPFYYYP